MIIFFFISCLNFLNLGHITNKFMINCLIIINVITKTFCSKDTKVYSTWMKSLTHTRGGFRVVPGCIAGMSITLIFEKGFRYQVIHMLSGMLLWLRLSNSTIKPVLNLTDSFVFSKLPMDSKFICFHRCSLHYCILLVGQVHGWQRPHSQFQSR